MGTPIGRRRGLHTLIAVTLLTSAATMGIGSARADDPATFALPGCRSSAEPSLERPETVLFQACGTGAKRLVDLSWTAWGPGGADGTGIYTYPLCKPDCATGPRPRLRVAVHADEPLAAPPGAECPANTQMYANLTLAYLDPLPAGFQDPVDEVFHGKPATLYSTALEYLTHSDTVGSQDETAIGNGRC